MEEKLKELAQLIVNVRRVTNDLKGIIDSQLVSTSSSAYAFLFMAWSASDHAGDHLNNIYEDLRMYLKNGGKLS